MLIVRDAYNIYILYIYYVYILAGLSTRMIELEDFLVDDLINAVTGHVLFVP